MVPRVDTITRDIILKLTTRVANLEAAVEVHHTMMRESAQERAIATNTSFDPAVFELQRAEAINQQREKMALGTEIPETAPGTPVVLDLPEVSQV